jgi:type I restriction enzyme S subunit
VTAYSTARIAQFCETGSGTTPPRDLQSRYYGPGLPWVKSGELKEGVILSTEESVTPLALSETSLRRVPAGALLVAMYGANVGRVAQLGVEATTNQAICHVVPDEAVADKRYMFHALCASARSLVARGVGGAQPNISQGTVRDLTVPLPPLAEQRRIAAILDQADALRAKRRAALTLAERIASAFFAQSFGEEEKPPVVPLGECAEVVSGVAKGRKLGAAVTRDVPYLRVANVQAGRLELGEVKTIPATEAEITELRLLRGDVLLTEGGDFDKLGRGAVWQGELPECIHQNHVFRVRPDASRLLPEFFAAFLLSRQARAYFLRCAKRTTNLASINMSQLRSMPVLMPPLEAQRRFVAALAAQRRVVDLQEAESAKMDALFSGLQHRAFRGEL